VRILLAGDHEVMREVLRPILEKEGVQIVGEAASGQEAIGLALRLRPDLVVLALPMPGLSGVDVTRRLVSEVPRPRIIALSLDSDRRHVLAMFKAGVEGYLLKSSAPAELITAVRAVAEGMSYVSPSVAFAVIDTLLDRGRPEAGQQNGLSPRQREVLQLLADGKSSRDIAGHLGLGVPTVATYRRQIMDKLNIRTIAELTKYAIREGLTSLD
jgi:DNA-binding NarL/FixJ family response regulator